MMKKIIAMLLMSALATPAMAEKTPLPMSSDARIRRVIYDSSEVYQITGTYGFTTTVEFESGETVQYLALGDTIAWEAIPMGNRIHLKPVEPNASTNLTVITDRRSYYFKLSSNKGKEASEMTYLLRFSYPQTTANVAVNPNAVRVQPAMPATASRGSASDTLNRRDQDDELNVTNCVYSASGSRRIVLLRACDNGKFTYLQFAPGSPMPAVFAVAPNGDESVVNFHMEGKYLVVERLGRQFTLRNGNEVLCIFNEAKSVDEEASDKKRRLPHGV
jgi:type IV secretion system protein VirB9